MKKLLLTGLITFIMISCSGDDKNQSTQDKITGSWQKSSLFIEGIDQNLSYCQQQTVYNFNVGQIFFWTNTYEENLDGECILLTTSGDWQKLSDTVYAVNTEFEGAINYVVEFPDDNTLKLTHNDSSEEQPHLIVTVFIRIEL